MKKIEPNAYVVLDYALRNDDGTVLDASDSDDGEPMEYVHGYGMLVPGLESALAGLSEGDEKNVKVAPDEAFGERDEDLVLHVERADFPNPDALEVGDEITVETNDGEEIPMQVLSIEKDVIVVDANHPLAGVTLHYAVKIRSIRAATEEEIADAASDFEEAGYGEDEPHTHGGDGEAPQQLIRLRPKK